MNVSAYDTLRRRAAERVSELELDPLTDRDRIRAEVDQLVSAYQRRARAGNGTRPFRDPVHLSDRLIDSLVGYGPLTPIIDRHDIEEVFIEGDRITFIDLSGRLQALDAPSSEEENRQIVARILAGTNRRLDTSNPIEQARVLGGRARLTAVIPPVADRLSVTLRKYTVKNYDLVFMVEREVLSPQAAAFLWAAAQANTTILFSGPPGAGKDHPDERLPPRCSSRALHESLRGSPGAGHPAGTRQFLRGESSNPRRKPPLHAARSGEGGPGPAAGPDLCG